LGWLLSLKTLEQIRIRISPRKDQVGKGAYSIVYKASERGSDKLVAIKKSRVSNRVKRTILLLQVLQGGPLIPVVYGYGQLDHFEYMAMELLGPSVADQQLKGGAGVMVETVIRVVYQVDYSISTPTALYIAISNMKTCFAH